MERATTHSSVARLIRRAANLLRKLRAGLTPFGENVSPEVPNDLFVAHLSIYDFAKQYARAARVLDIGCGAGYGSEYLRKAGATDVVGLDLDPRNVRYAQRRYPGIEFRQADAERLPSDLGQFDLIVASNVLEHLHDVRPALDALRSMARGSLIVAVPPIVDENSMRENEAIPYHRSNHMVTQWFAMLQERFPIVETYRHVPHDGTDPDFSNPFASHLTPGDFSFQQVTTDELLTKPTLTALFVAR